jgi:TolB-like protein/DNA-binding winged helix-turn-helix (wHTH) protein/Tfp pilus assembly protein PilF
MPLSPLRIYRFGDLTLDLVRGSLQNGRGDIALRRKSFVLLTYFVTNAGRLLPKDELMNAIWPGVFVTEESLVQCVGEIRRAMGDGGQALIKTVPGRGYLFDAPVTMVAPAETAATGEAPPVVPIRREWLIGAYGKFAAAALVLLCLGVAGWLALRVSTPVAPRLSIVVLPFVNLSNDPDQDYFADGITDNLTTDISYIGTFVIARNTAFTYKGKTIDAKEIGRELGVRYLLEGSVQRSGNQIRINAQLIDAETGSHLWAETFDRELGDLLAIEDEITARIAHTLGLQLIDIEARRAERRGTSADAMDYVMRGNALANRPVFTKEKYRAAEQMFEKALQLDEHLPSALAGLADARTGNVLDGFSDTPESDLQRADELVSEILAANPNNFPAHAVKAQILRAQKRYEEAIVEYDTAIALNPMCLGCLIHLARAKILIGEPAAAIPLLNRALLISPRDPEIGFMHYRLGLANLLLGNTDEAIRWYKTAVLTYYEPADAFLELGAALSLKGEMPEAKAALAEAARLHPERMTIASVRTRLLSERPKFVELREQTVLKGLRTLGLPEQ